VGNEFQAWELMPDQFVLLFGPGFELASHQAEPISDGIRVYSLPVPLFRKIRVAV
jgi:hypothetical protein